jgi:SAM-dependent methyltransferase
MIFQAISVPEFDRQAPTSAVPARRDVAAGTIEWCVPEKQRWERAEVERSAVEASLTPEDSLRVSARTLARYERPPADTPYPLEYSYHLLGDVRRLRIVDFGCGSGANSVLLANRGADVIGVDISGDLIALARRRMQINGRADGARFVVCSGYDLPFADASIDIVFGMAILHHLDLLRASEEIARVLRPGGRAIFQEPVRNSPLVRFVRALIPYRQPDVSPFERPLTDGELREFARPFASARVRAFCLPHVALGQKLPLVKTKVDLLYRSDRAIVRRIPALEYYAGIRVIEVTK